MVAGSCEKSKNASDQCAHQKTVKTGIREGDRVQIVEGLQAGDRVVATGRLRPTRQQQNHQRGSPAGGERISDEDE